MNDDDKVVPLRPPAEPELKGIWTCGCGSQQHYIYEDGTAACYICGSIGPPGTWSEFVVKHLIEEQNDIRLKENTSYGTADFARAAVLKKAKERPDVAFVFVGYNDGGSSVWSNIDGEPTDEQRAWYRRRAEDCLALAFDEPLPPLPKPEKPDAVE